MTDPAAQNTVLLLISYLCFASLENRVHAYRRMPLWALVLSHPSTLAQAMYGRASAFGRTFVLVSLALLAGCQRATVPPAPTPLNWRTDDSTRVARLHSEGVLVEGRHLVAWFPRNSVSEDHMRALVDSLDVALPALQAFLGGPYPWQRLGPGRITYYFAEDRFISHAPDRAVFIPIGRVRTGEAPYLHEAAHVLLRPHAPYDPWELADSVTAEHRYSTDPLWLLEGLPDVAAQTVARQVGLNEGDVFEIGGIEGADRTCVARLQHPGGAEILPFLGGSGSPDALYTSERQEVAPIFYACSQSLVHFLVARAGAPFLASLFPEIPQGRVEERIEERTGRSISELRAEWLRQIGAPESAAAG